MIIFHKKENAIVIFIVIVWLVSSLLINKQVTFSIEPKACKYGFCISGLPIELNLELDKGVDATFTISSDALLENTKNYTTTSSQPILQEISLETKDNLPAKSYSFNIKVQQSFWKFVIDPWDYMKYSLFGTSINLNFDYPKITIQTDPKVKQACQEGVGIYFNRILIDSKEEMQYDCSIRIATAGLVSISHKELKAIEINQNDFKTAYITSYYNVQQNSNSTGIEDVEVKPTNCQVGNVQLSIYPVCNIGKKEIIIKYNEPLSIDYDDCDLRQSCKS